MNPVDNIRLEDLSGEQLQLATIVGIEAYRELVRQFGGTHIYVPEHNSFRAMRRNEKIRKDFDGYNFRELARKYDLSESMIRRIVRDVIREIRHRPLEGQITFF